MTVVAAGSPPVVWYINHSQRRVLTQYSQKSAPSTLCKHRVGGHRVGRLADRVGQVRIAGWQTPSGDAEGRRRFDRLLDAGNSARQYGRKYEVRIGVATGHAVLDARRLR